MLALLIIAVVLLVLVLSLLVFVLLKINKIGKENSSTDSKIEQEDIFKTITNLSDSIAKPTIAAIDELKKTLNENISSLNSYVNELKNISNETKVELIKTTNDHEVKLIKELNNNFTSINDRLVSNNEVTIKKLDDKLNSISDSLKETLEKIEKTTKDSISDIRKDNNEKLDSIQNLVSNKLEDTLNKRLKESFGNVIEQINGVNKAIGEIKGLANDVGSLKNVLTNVKTKGITGEIILGNLISEILTKNQYDENVITKPGSKDRVEFAIKMPGNGEGEYIYLPVDSKFPTTQYQRILEGIDEGNKDKIEDARKQLRIEIKQFAKDISTKYIDEPNTTSFGIMFLPIEGLYAEVINMGLFEELQREYKVNVTGPSTFAALLNALQMGFKSLVIQKKSADVFKLLTSVKTEFGRFAEVLDKAMKKVDDAGKELNTLVGTRTRAIRKQLDKIEDVGELENIETVNS